MQGLADGYFVIPHTVDTASEKFDKVDTDHPEFARIEKEVTEKQEASQYQRQKICRLLPQRAWPRMWDKCGMARNKKGLEEAIKKILRFDLEFWENVKVLGDGMTTNQSLKKGTGC